MQHRTPTPAASRVPTALLALLAHAVMLAGAGAPAVLAGVPPTVMLADAGAPRSPCTSGAPPAVMFADAGARAVLAGAPPAVMLADAVVPAVPAVAPSAVLPAGAPAVLAGAPNAVMLADAGAPAVLALGRCGNLGLVHPAANRPSGSRRDRRWAQQRAGGRPTDSPQSGARVEHCVAARGGRRGSMLFSIFKYGFFIFFYFRKMTSVWLWVAVLLGTVAQVAGDGYACKSIDDCSYFGCK